MDDAQAGLPEASALMRMATGYLARYAASSQRVRQVLERRIRRRCRMQSLPEPEPDALAAALDDLVERLRSLGLLDDQLFGSSRARTLERKGLPDRRIRMTLRSEGLDDALDQREEPIDDRAQARRFAARKRLGPYRTGAREPFRDKDIRSLLRAGFSFQVAAATVDSTEGPDG